MFNAFWKGIAAGLAIAAPVGPIGLLCIRRTLASGRLTGFLAGLGAATADFVYGLIAAAGLSALNAWLTRRGAWLSAAGAIFLIVLGIRIWRDRLTVASGRAAHRGMAASFGSTFLLTLTNPMTVVSFAGLLAGLGATAGATTAAPFALAAGVFTGSAAWWLTLTSTTAVIRRRLSPQLLRWVNRLSATVLIAFALNVLRPLIF